MQRLAKIHELNSRSPFNKKHFIVKRISRLNDGPVLWLVIVSAKLEAASSILVLDKLFCYKYGHWFYVCV